MYLGNEVDEQIDHHSSYYYLNATFPHCYGTDKVLVSKI